MTLSTHARTLKTEDEAKKRRRNKTLTLTTYDGRYVYKHSLGRTSSDVPAFSSRSLNSLQLSVNRFLSIHIFVFSARLQMSSWPTLSRTDRMLSKIIGEGKRSCFDVMGTRPVSIATHSRDRFAQNVVSLPFGQTAWRLISHIFTMCANFGPDFCPAICIRQTIAALGFAQT